MTIMINVGVGTLTLVWSQNSTQGPRRPTDWKKKYFGTSLKITLKTCTAEFNDEDPNPARIEKRPPHVKRLKWKQNVQHFFWHHDKTMIHHVGLLGIPFQKLNIPEYKATVYVLILDLIALLLLDQITST